MGQWSEKRNLTANGAAALTSITVQFVDSPAMAATRAAAGASGLAAAAKLGMIGVATIKEVKHRRELLFAAMPCLFALHPS